MSASEITKRHIATTLKEMVRQQGFSSLSVGELIRRCDISRNTFYYHFRDKYDLVNWIYYTECVAVLKEKDYCTEWELLEDLCAYFYKNRTFYRKTLSVDGQNSFSEYFRDILAAILAETMEGNLGQDPHLDFYVEFYTDAFLCALKRWLLAKDCMPAEEFTTLLRSCLLKTSTAILQQLSPQQETT